MCCIFLDFEEKLSDDFKFVVSADSSVIRSDKTYETMANENRKLSRYLKRKLNLKEAQEEIEQMVKKKAPCHQKVNNHFSDNEISSNPQQSEQPSSEPVTCVLTSQFHEDEDPKVRNIYICTCYLHLFMVYSYVTEYC